MEGEERDLNSWKEKKDKSIWNGREMNKWNERKEIGLSGREGERYG